MSDLSSTRTERDLSSLAVAGVALALIAAFGLAMPGSVFEFREIRESTPLEAIYATETAHLFLIGVLLALALVWVGAVVAAGRLTSRRAAAVVLGGTLLLGIVFVFVFPSGSLDIYHNIADARTLWLHGDNPLRVPPSEHLDSEIVRAVRAWRERTSAYGPLSYVLYGPPVIAAGGGVLANLLAFKAYQAFLLLALTWLVGKATADLWPERRVQAMVLVGWNPFVLYEGVGNGHNDLAMMVFAAAGLVLTVRLSLWGPAGLLLAGGVKFLAGLATPLAALWLWRRGSWEQRRFLVAAGALLIILAAVGAIVLADDVDRIRRFTTPRADGFYSPVSVATDLLGEGSSRVALYLARSLLVVVGLAVLLRLDRTATSLWRGSFWLMAAASALVATTFWPWYLLWFIPLGAGLAGSREADCAIVASVVALVAYGVFPWLEHNDAVNAAYVALVFGLPVAYAFLAIRLRLPTTQLPAATVAAVEATAV